MENLKNPSFFLNTPNLPDQPVGLVLVSEEIPRDVTDSLLRLGIEIIYVPACGELPPSVACHADMNVCDLGGGRVVAAQNNPVLCERLSKIFPQVLRSQSPPGRKYPFDIPLNVLLIDRVCFGKSGCIDGTITEYCQRRIEIVPVKQGVQPVFGVCGIKAGGDHSGSRNGEDDA